ncbi:MAG: hypothetical protein KDC92_15215 [Bacteroidetes bacterium]|nr:hypothetical protein [Bacteroidota bacterium]
MSNLRSLASQTALYGGTTILGRLLNFALIPLYTRVLPGTVDTGVVIILYSYVALLNVMYNGHGNHLFFLQLQAR